ncbi:efflux transporter outer membrane subunit [Ferrimonas balearica]|uniref:efflux transporter outer membrane subunit n=1 Tax=Ferrimonas balearica TaxID=44012 RepID=UPI001C98EAD3|nr:efflux transporter outer membrane subunit [Ferrimonas balearica]MBY5990870.1 efflux transporter outer membrane subunit [Ferrimonas balearica]
MRKLSVLLISMALAGCSVTPEYQAPTTEAGDLYLNQAVAGVAGAPIEDEAWWRRFNDPELDALVASVQQQNISLQLAQQRIQSARAYRSAVATAKIPTVSVGAGYHHARLSEYDPLLGGALTATMPDLGQGGAVLPPAGQDLNLLDRDNGAFVVGANVSWEMDLFGRLDAMDQLAGIRLEQAEILRQGTLTMVTTEAVHNYLQYRGAQARLAIAERNVEEQEVMVALVERLQSAGYGSELDRVQAEALLAATRASLPLLRTAEQAHLGRLATLLGEGVSDTQQRFSARPLPRIEGRVPVGLKSELLQRRPDIALAEREMAAVNQEVGVAIAARYPKVFLTGSPASLAENFEDLFSSGSEAWLASVGVQWTLFDGGRGQALVEMQEARFQQAALSYQYQVNQAFNEVETALMAYGNQQGHQSQIDTAAEQARLAADKARSLYRAGLVDFLAVLDAQRQVNLMEDAALVARLNTANHLVFLHKALGGDWSVVPDPA